ncbi:hypothetical protein CSPX01_01576 [Colletotrichum filicis]|nr:hypothetical protein CSPX01_01576 [Colletotrichum filicis]
MAITRSSNSSAIPPSEDVPFPESVAAHHPGAQTSVVLRYSTPAHQHRRRICTSCDPSTARYSEITWRPPFETKKGLGESPNFVSIFKDLVNHPASSAQLPIHLHPPKRVWLNSAHFDLEALSSFRLSPTLTVILRSMCFLQQSQRSDSPADIQASRNLVCPNKAETARARQPRAPRGPNLNQDACCYKSGLSCSAPGVLYCAIRVGQYAIAKGRRTRRPFAATPIGN